MRRIKYFTVMILFFVYVIALLFFISGCSVDSKIDRWEKKEKEELTRAFDRELPIGFVSYYHKSKDMEKLNESLRRLALSTGTPFRSSDWGTLTVSISSHRLSDTDSLKSVDIKEIDAGVLKTVISRARSDFIKFLKSLNLERKIERKYLDFKTELVCWNENQNKQLTIMEISSWGRLKNRIFLLEFNEDALEKARKNYESRFNGSQQSDETYIYTLYITNKNERIPLYIYDVILEHKRKGALEYKELDKGRDYKQIEPKYARGKVIMPSLRETIKLHVERYYGKYGALQCRYRVDIGWLE